VRVVITPQSKRFPCRSVVWIGLHYMLENRNRVFVRTRIVRQRQTVQIKVIRSCILWTSLRIKHSARRAETRKQPLTYLSRHACLQRNQIVRLCSHVGLPEQSIRLNLNCLERNQQLVALLQKVPGENI